MSFPILVLSFVSVAVWPGELAVTIIEAVLELPLVLAASLKCHLALTMELSPHKLALISQTIFHNESSFSMIQPILESPTVRTALADQIPLQPLSPTESSIKANAVPPLLPLPI